ncbi:Autoinducer 2 sensor kinase/phosphatase LuxQ [Stieleria neptunia]|uniref:Autoinducer 2 sensor kinase/phosphatase LuxQ n=1 Tax=Stieleria neptunia TaxID=2527979 RepID=A0A518HXH9_9BACT|nr:chemotaxis protein CheB [Stieleria neptunia]QDV45562.1 Autoinducer 2 sensor kinase/phosphatase LuxQ [Stieleria neptunia]
MTNETTKVKETPLVVGIGASAGGLEAVREFLQHLGRCQDLAIVLVLHHDASSKPLLGDLLDAATEMTVAEVTERTKLRPGVVYLAPANRFLDVKHGGILPVVPGSDESPLNSVDHFFHSLARDQAERAIGIVLSGTGSDGTVGLKAIGDAGGLTFAQDTASAKYDSMPRSAATLGAADHVCRPSEMADELRRYTDHLNRYGDEQSVGRVQNQIAEAIPRIAEHLFEVTGHHFQHYKITTLTRRLLRRMHVLKIASAAEYLSHLQRSEEETHALFRELLIGVTAFFRDPEAFNAIATTVLPQIFDGRRPDDVVRIWVAGCSTGEEAYSLAMLCREQVDAMEDPPEVRIFATDIDDRALQIARTGSYPTGIEDHVSAARLKRFFVRRGKRYQVTQEVRELVLFSKHNLISDPPFSRQDLISCRNLLIYLGEHLQEKLIPLFHYATRPAGFLFLGPSETISTHGELFKSFDTKCRISQRKGTATGSISALVTRRGEVKPVHAGETQSDATIDLNVIRQRILLDEFTPKAVVIDQTGTVLNASDGVSKYLEVSGGDFHNHIIKMALPSLRIGLRAALSEAKKARRRVTHDHLSIRDGELIQRVMLTVQPMPQLGEDAELFMVVFHDVGEPMRREEFDHPPDASSTGDHDADVIIAQLERELESTRSDLERTLQDMEAANEELKSSNEELLSMNEELQSANEELETSKEEIRAGSDAVARAHADLENLLRSTQIATVFLDNERRIRSFTPAIKEIYALIPTDVGRPLEHFVPRVRNMPPLPDPATIQSTGVIEDTVVGESGRSYIRRVSPYRSRGGLTDGIVVTFVDVSELVEREAMLASLMSSTAEGIYGIDLDGRCTFANAACAKLLGYQNADAFLGQSMHDMIHHSRRDGSTYGADECRIARAFRNGEPVHVDDECFWRTDGSSFDVEYWSHPQIRDGETVGCVVTFIDITERRSAETELADAKDRLELSLQIADVAPWSWDVRSGQPISNPILNRLFGFAENESPSLHDFLERIDPSVRNHISSAIQNAIAEGNIYDEEYPVRLPSGEVRHLRARGRVRRSADGVAEDFFGVVVDITDRKRRELDLADREAHLRRVINNQLGLVGVIDRGGRLLEIDDGSLQIARARREDVVGKPFAEAPWWNYDPAVVQQTRAAMARAFAGEVVRYDVSLFAHGSDGVMIDFMIAPVFDADGNVEFLIPSGVDIRDRVKIEKEQRSVTRRMEMALRAGGMAAWEWTPTKSIWTPELYELLGIDSDQEACSDLFFSLVHPDDVEPLKQAWQDAIEGSDTYDSEFRIIRPDGAIRWMNGLGEVVRDQGKVIQMYGVNWDSTEEHLQAEALRESERRAHQASASKSEFLANMSHEIRTPMTAILGYAELLKDLVDHHESQQYLQTIRRNGDYLLEIINDILDLSKIEAGKLDVQQERFEPCRLIEDVRSIMEVRAKEGGLTLEIEYDGKLPRMILSDAKRLKQILINLVGNAIKFTKQGGVKIRIRFEVSSQQLQFDVIDTGIGISAEQMSQLFKPFSQGDASVTRHFGGTGLGLAISQRLAEMLGGNISASSTEGVGSTFTLRIATGDVSPSDLVRYLEPRSDGGSGPTPPTSTLGKLSCHVLIVDDRQDIRFLSRHILTKAGATVDECEDGVQAVEHLSACLKTGDCPDLILLDMQMPNLDGYSTSKKLREIGYRGPIIALTADAMQGDMNKCLEAGCNDYLSKPIDAAKMIRVVGEATSVDSPSGCTKANHR